MLMTKTKHISQSRITLRSNRNIVFYISLMITGFSIGYIGYKSISYAWAECEPSKTAQLKLDSVSTDDSVDEPMVTTEGDRWPTDASIVGHIFLAYQGAYAVRFSKDDE